MSLAGTAIAGRPSGRAAIVRLTALLALVPGLAGCGVRLVTLPDDAGSPLPGFAAIHQEATRACQGVRTLDVEIALSGHAGDQGLNRRVQALFERPDSMRFQVVGLFGRVDLLLASRAGEAVLLIPRDNSVVIDAPEEILGALTGVDLAPADILAVLTGCVVPAPVPGSGRLHANGWASIALGGGAVVYLERDGDWRPLVGRRDGWRIDYLGWQGRFPRAVRLQRLSGTPAVDVTATLSQIFSNLDSRPGAFTLDVPADAVTVTLDELRQGDRLGEPE